MGRYRFRLETLNKVRAAKRDQARAALAEAFQAEQVLAQSQQELAFERAALRDYERATTDGDYLDVNRLLGAQRYELVLRAKDQDLAHRQALLLAELEQRRLALMEADRDVRALELLDERHRRAHALRQRRAEIKELDEVALGSRVRASLALGPAGTSDPRNR